MSELRLLLVTDAVGGVWTYSLELARALRPLGIEATLAVMGPAATEQQVDDAGDIRVVDTGLPLEWLASDAGAVHSSGRAIAALAAAEGVDIVQTSSAALLADADLRQPSVAVQHSCVASWWAAVKGTPLPQDFEWRRALVETGLRRADAIVAPSIAFAAETSRLYGVHAVPVHNGRGAMWRRDIPQGDFVFTAGRLWDEGKNVATLDAAAARVRVPFQAAGSASGPNDTHLELKHVEALGQLSDTRLAGLFAARPIYASAALYEPFGLSVLEAAQAGCALVLSDIPTHREIWGGAAIFVPARDDAAFARAIQDLLHDRDEREQLGQLARSRAAHYTPERMARGMAAIYARLAPQRSEPIQLAGAA
ncbi:MAG TPA: glycosyltransferase family 4 protein [Sphingomicrobium sp.]